jgi:DNA-binding protein HU-beta
LANELAEQHQLSKKQGPEMMKELIGMITKHLKKGERVRIAGLGILQVRKRAARHRADLRPSVIALDRRSRPIPA